ncbi:MAG: choice-of-anchor A family protein [Burkholderiales bacterium]|nr:choice-of-anchor A family protein [Burkholderiales bacterium]
MPRQSLIRLSALAATLVFASSAHATITNLNFGAAEGYSAFFFGNASKVMDVEGRFAVGGNLDTSGFSFGYRTPFGVTGPSLVVGGNVHLGTGAIFSGPKTNIDTNATIGPITSWEKPIGYGVFGGSNSSLAVHDLRQATPIDFASAKTQLTKLSGDLKAETANGTVESKWGGLYLTGDNTSKTQIFTINSNTVGNLFLQNVKSDAQVIINVNGSGGKYVFSGGQDGQLEALRSRVLFNFNNATEVKISTFTWGTILAPKANILGTGHIEGSVIANSIAAQVEIGYEPWKNTSPVPEADTWAMLLAGLGLLGIYARRRSNG